MTGMGPAFADAHRKNLERYCQLLSMDLTPTERDYLHRRIAETRLALDQAELGAVPRRGHAPNDSGKPRPG